MIRKGQSRAWIFFPWIERDLPILRIATIAGDGSGNHLRTTKLFRTSRDSQGMKTLEIFVVADGMPDLRAREDVESSACEIDHRRRCNSDLGADESALHIVGRERPLAAGFVEETYLPERRIAWSIDVESVNAVMLGGDEDEVVSSFAGHFDVRQIEWLRINRAIDLKGSEFPKLFRVDVEGVRVFSLRSLRIGSCRTAKW
jgi:hypothetical protein